MTRTACRERPLRTILPRYITAIWSAKKWMTVRSWETIADDGIGGAGPAGSGLANITDRVSALNGSTIIDSPPGNGTRIVVSIPCA